MWDYGFDPSEIFLIDLPNDNLGMVSVCTDIAGGRWMQDSVGW